VLLKVITTAIFVGLTIATLNAGLDTSRGAPPAAPLAQATATPTLPPFIDYGAGWGAQALPRGGVNCFVRGEIPRAGVAPEALGCVSGTPVTP
jgi:hypothetical protein